MAFKCVYCYDYPESIVCWFSCEILYRISTQYIYPEYQSQFCKLKWFHSNKAIRDELSNASSQVIPANNSNVKERTENWLLTY